MKTLYNIFYSNSYLKKEATDVEEGLPLLPEVSRPVGSVQRKVVWDGDDISINVFDFLAPPHLIHAIGLVCKQWRHLSSHSFLVWNKFLPNHFVAQQAERDYCQTYLDWLAMGWRCENEEFTSKRIVSPFGGFITTMATLADRLILGSNRGFISVLDTQKTKLLSSTRIQAGHAIQCLDALAGCLAFATLEEKYLKSEEQYFKRLVNPSAVKGTLQFWHLKTLTPDKTVEFDHMVKSIKIHAFEDKMGTQTIVAVHVYGNRLFIFDRRGQVLDSLAHVSSFCLNDDELFVIRRENEERFLAYYRLQSGETPYLKELKKHKTPLPLLTVGMNVASKKLFLYSDKAFYEIDRQDWLEDRLDCLQATTIKNIKKIVHLSLERKIAVTEVHDPNVLPMYALTFFNKNRVEATWFACGYRFNFVPFVAIADKKCYVLGSREPMQRVGETLALDCYDLTSPNYLGQLASKINWVTGKRSFCSYILSEKKWAVFGIPFLMGQAALGLAGASVLGAHDLVPSKLLNTIQFVHLLASGLLVLTYPLSMHRVYQEESIVSMRLLASMMFLPLALLTSHKLKWSQSQFLEMLNGFLLWRIKKIRQDSQKESQQLEPTDSLQAICPISRAPIRHPVESDGKWFEKSWHLEFLEYAFMISGETTGDFEMNDGRESEEFSPPGANV